MAKNHDEFVDVTVRIPVDVVKRWPDKSTDKDVEIITKAVDKAILNAFYGRMMEPLKINWPPRVIDDIEKLNQGLVKFGADVSDPIDPERLRELLGEVPEHCPTFVMTNRREFVFEPKK